MAMKEAMANAMAKAGNPKKAASRGAGISRGKAAAGKAAAGKKKIDPRMLAALMAARGGQGGGMPGGMPGAMPQQGMPQQGMPQRPQM